MTSQSIEVQIGASYAVKIRLIQKAISDPTTYAKVLEGLIDMGYANALKNLYESGEISSDDFRKGKQHLPDYLREAMNN